MVLSQKSLGQRYGRPTPRLLGNGGHVTPAWREIANEQRTASIGQGRDSSTNFIRGKMKPSEQTDGRVLVYIRESTLRKAKGTKAVVKIAAAGRNFIDVYNREGRYKAPLLVWDRKRRAWCRRWGSDVRDVKVGDRVPNPCRWVAMLSMLPCRREAGEDSSWSKAIAMLRRRCSRE